MNTNSKTIKNKHLPVNNEVSISMHQPKIHQQSQISGTFTIDHNHYYHQPYPVDVYSRPIQTTQLHNYNCIAEDSNIKLNRNYMLPNTNSIQQPQPQPCFYNNQTYPPHIEQYYYDGNATQVREVSKTYQNHHQEILPGHLTNLCVTSNVKQHLYSENYG